MSISLEEVRDVARLARLKLDEAEVFALQGELNSLLGHFVDIEDLDPGMDDGLTHGMAFANVWAQDRIAPGFSDVDALRNAPRSKAGLFVVPTIIED